MPPEASMPASSSLTAELAAAFPQGAGRVLVVKALADEDFAHLLSSIQQALPNASLTIATASEHAGAAEEVGEVLRPSMGKRALLNRLQKGFDICIIAVGAWGLGGKKRLQADFMASVASVSEKIFCSPESIIRRQGKAAVHLAPALSGARWMAGLCAALLCGGAAWLLLSILAVVYEVVGGLVYIIGGRRPPKDALCSDSKPTTHH